MKAALIQNVYELARQAPLRRFVLSILLAMGSVLTVGLFSEGSAEWVVRYLGYFFVLAISLGAVGYLCLACRGGMSAVCTSLKQLLICGGAVLVGAWVVFVHAELDYKIAMDDYSLASTAKHLHETREVAMPTMVIPWGDSIRRLEVDVDKRPWLYPFLVATVHDIFGYSEQHPFLLNAAICVVFLASVYVFACMLAGTPAGVLAVLLWASLPLLSQNATGAGMEMLNLCILQLLCLLGVYYLKRPSANLEALMCLVAVLLTYTRYESGIFIFPTIVVVLLGWWRAKAVFLSWGAVLSSVALIAVAAQTRIYSMTESSWELAEGVTRPFAWDHLITNLPHALNFFFSPDDTLANSLLLGVVALPAVIAFIILLRTELKVYWQTNAAGLISVIFGIFILIQLVIVLSFHAGQFDQRIVSRYSLPFHWLIITSTVAILGYASNRWSKVWLASYWVVGLFIVIVTLPNNSKAIFNRSNFVVREFNWFEELVQDELAPRALYLDKYRIFWSLKEMTVVPPAVIADNIDKLVEYVERRMFTEVYCIRRARFKNGQFVSVDSEFELLATKLDFELVTEKSFRPLELTQIYRLSGVKNLDPDNTEVKGSESE